MYNGGMETSTPQPRPSTQPRAQRPAARSGQLSSLQVMFAVVLAVGLLLTINFSSRIAAGRPLLDAYEAVKVEIEKLEADQKALLEERDYSLSDFYVENWARGRGKMIKPGDKLFIPVPSNTTAEATPVPIVLGEFDPGTEQPENWELWWGLFFDAPPPEFNQQ
jgi:cell division protein FtsB